MTPNRSDGGPQPRARKGFLCGAVGGDRKGRLREGAPIRTSIRRTPLAFIDVGRVVETLHSRCLLRDRRGRLANH